MSRLRAFLCWWTLLALTISLRTSAAGAPGTLDQTFLATNLFGGAVITELADGKVLFSGASAALLRPTFTNKVAIRLNADGTLDNSFSSPADSSVIAGHIVREDGKVLVYGRFNTLDGFDSRGVAMLNDDGSIDRSWRVSELPEIGFSFQPSMLQAAADSAFYGAFTDGRIVRVRADGSLDNTFKVTPAIPSGPVGIAVLPSGKLIVLNAGKVFRLNQDGSRDSGYTESTFDNLLTTLGRFAVTPDGGIYVSSNTGKLNGGDFRTLARLLPDGGVNPSFKFAQDGASAFSRSVGWLALESTGKLLVTGSGLTPTMFRILPTGAVDATWNNFMNGAPTVFALDHAGRVLVSGTYFQVDFTVSPPLVLVRSGINRLNNDAGPVGPSKPIFAVQPVDLQVRSGELARFTSLATGEKPITYQWQAGEQDIAGAVDPALTINPALVASSGSYRVIATNPQGSVTSTPALLTVDGKPFITSVAPGFTVVSGVDTNLAAVVAGEPPLSLQWFQDLSPVSGGTAAMLPLPNISKAARGEYVLVATNQFGAATSGPVVVDVLQSRPDWLILTNRADGNTFSSADNPFRPEGALKMISDGPRGVVMLHTRGVERWDDAGERIWSARYLENDFGTLRAMTVDKAGNTYVSGMLHFTAEFGGMRMTNNSAVTGPNGHQQAFIAKLDPKGNGLWYRLLEAAGPTIWSLSPDVDGNIVFAGRIGGSAGFTRALFGNLSVSETSYSAAVVGKIGSDGVPMWFKTYQQFASNKSTCEANGITADASGIYITGLISFSIQFGTTQYQNPGNWIAKMSSDGLEQWIRPAGGSPTQGSPLASAAGNIWFMVGRDRSLVRFDTNGSVAASIIVAANAQNANSVEIRDFSLTKSGEPLVVGKSVGYLYVGTNLVNAGTSRPLVWFGQWDTNGNQIRGRALSTTTNANPLISSDTVNAGAFAAGATGDLYLAGSFAGGMRFLGKNYSATDAFGGSATLAKISKPALLPEIIQHPVPEYTMDTGGEVQIGIRAAGPDPLTYQWRKNGEPIPGATADIFKFTNAIVSDSGLYDVVVSNPYGEVVTDAAKITVRPPFTISIQPQDRLVILSGELSGDQLGVAAMTPNSLSDKSLKLFITNTTSVRFPLGGRFAVNLKPGSYEIPAGGDLGLHQGGWSVRGFAPDYASIILNPWTFTDGRPLGNLTLSAFGGFDLHLEIANADGCCAAGSYSMSGGSDAATFQVNTASFVPPGNFQWQKGEVNIPDATNSVFKIDHATAADAGYYRCVITYRGYSETSRSAKLVVQQGDAGGGPPTLDLHTFTFGPGTLTIPAWPAGFVLQRTTTLSPPNWQTIATTPPADITLDGKGGFFRLAK